MNQTTADVSSAVASPASDGVPAGAGITYVIPCGGEKLAHPAAARDLYQGQHFRHA